LFGGGRVLVVELFVAILIEHLDFLRCIVIRALFETMVVVNQLMTAD
jgi:hypothetical protein